MKSPLFSLLLSASMLAAATAAGAQVSVTIGQPGFYGRIEVGNAPRPVLVYPQPVIIQQVPQPPQAIYLRVPPGHAKKWSKHCHKYDACSRPVYFVKDDWYNNVYVPHYRSTHPSSSQGKGKNK